jgi:hypothetical protein
LKIEFFRFNSYKDAKVHYSQIAKKTLRKEIINLRHGTSSSGLLAIMMI